MNQFRAEYFPNTTLSGEPVLTRCESAIDYAWGSNAPGPGVPADNFSVRWHGKFRFEGGKYRFRATADDGIRFWLGGNLTLTEWRSQSSSFMRERVVDAGEHDIVFEYFEGTGNATARLTWELIEAASPATATPTRTPTPRATSTVPSTATHAPTATKTPVPTTTSTSVPTATLGPKTCPDGQFRAEFFNNSSIGGVPTRSQCDDAISYRWGHSGPGGDAREDNFSARWIGRHHFDGGAYTFRIFSDDGVRIWIDGALVLDEWRHQAQGWEFDRTIAAGLHDVRVEYFEGGGTATIVLDWVQKSGGSAPTATPPPTSTPAPTATATPAAAQCSLGQYRADYFANDSFSGQPFTSRCENAPIAADWQYGAPYQSLPADGFSVRYVGRFKFAAGDHVFTAVVDDGVRAWLNGTLLIDNAQNRPGTYTASRTFPPGVVGEEHEVRVEFVEKGGVAKVRFDWQAESVQSPATPTSVAPTSTAVPPSATPTPQAGQTPAPSPTSTPVASGPCNPSSLGLTVPSGFCIEDYATGLTAVRFMAYGPDGVLYATLPSQGRIVRLPDENGDGRADGVYTFASGLNRPHGLAFHNGYLYVAETDSLSRLRDADGDGDSDQLQRLASLPGDSVHWSRTVIVGADGKLYVSIGSSCDACVETDPRRATVMQFNADGSGGRVYARGLRNAVGLAVHPSTGQIWADGNERDGLGDNFPREILSRLIDGADYGWPRCINGTAADTRFSGDCSGVTPPVQTFQAHSAPLGMGFYTGTVFPSDYRGDLFIAFHGSWNRSVPTGYKVVRVPFANGQPTGEVFDFATGWLQANGSNTGRPVDVVTAPDGSLMISDDKGNRIYRVRHR